MPSPEVEWLPWQELMWVHKQEGQFSIALDQVEDNVTFTKRGVSFVSKASNRLGDGLEWMLEQMRRSETGRKMWAKDAWHARRVRRMSERSTHFLELLLFVVHTTGGQPARGTEITSCRHRNGFLQDRNIFVMDGQVVFVTEPDPLYSPSSPICFLHFVGLGWLASVASKKAWCGRTGNISSQLNGGRLFNMR